jgi:hypothetical protein
MVKILENYKLNFKTNDISLNIKIVYELVNNFKIIDKTEFLKYFQDFFL